MPVLDVEKQLDPPVMTVIAEFDAAPERVWALYADPRQLERVWGPPEWPATFTQHELVPGARSKYFMTGPEGERAGGVWNVVAVDEPRSFEVDDAFADADGEPDEAMGWNRMTVRLEPVGDRTRVSVVSTFQSAEQLQQMVEMGMEEGMKAAMGQIDAVLAEPAPTS